MYCRTLDLEFILALNLTVNLGLVMNLDFKFTVNRTIEELSNSFHQEGGGCVFFVEVKF